MTAWLPTSTLSLIVLILVLVAATHTSLRWWVRRRRAAAAAAAPADRPSTTRHWLARGLEEMLPPVALLLWIHGAYFVLGLLLASAPWWSFAPTATLILGWGYRLAIVAALIWLLARAGRVIEAFLLSLAHRTDATWDDVMLPLAGKAARRALPLLAIILAAPALARSPALSQIVGTATSLVLISVVAIILIQVVNAAAALVLQEHRIDVADNLRARAIHTQVVVLKKVAVSAIGLFTLASMLMVFDSVRQLGASILASAGVAGIVVGFAAQRSIATLLAGFQIALTQPIRVDDIVIVENEFGRIEDITLTYVVVRIWDLRRLVLPISYFIEHPFQNWTRSSSNLLATVYLQVDYQVPLDALRGELTRILDASPNWDRQVNVLQVTDAKERTLELRALASAANASLAWDLRCEVREKLVTFLQREYPESLPRVRASVEARIAGGMPTGQPGV
jgi:small-conductance mechanosensitive channel